MNIGRGISELGPTMTLDTLVEVLLISIGTISGEGATSHCHGDLCVYYNLCLELLYIIWISTVKNLSYVPQKLSYPQIVEPHPLVVVCAVAHQSLQDENVCPMKVTGYPVISDCMATLVAYTLNARSLCCRCASV